MKTTAAEIFAPSASVTMNPQNEYALLRKRLSALRTDLMELGFSLDCRRQADAADVAVTTSARIAEILADSPEEI